MKSTFSKARRRRMVSLAAASAAVIALTGCATTEVGGGSTASPTGSLAGPGVDSETKTITIGEITAMSGPVSQIGVPVHNGLQAHVEWINAHGGVDGWKLKLNTQNSAYQPQKTVELYNEIHDDVALLSNLGTPTTAAILPSIAQDSLVTSGVSVAWSDSSELALIGTPYGPDAANLISYLATEADAADSKFGIVLQNDGFGEDNLLGYSAAVEELGLMSVAEARYNSGDTDFKSQAAQLKSSGAEYVFVAATAPAAAGIIGTAESIGYEPTWVLAAAPAADTRLFTEDGSAAGATTEIARVLDGGYAGVLATPFVEDSTVKGFDDVVAARDEFAPDSRVDAYFTLGWNLGTVYESILRKAITDGDLSRAGILEAKTTLGEVDMGGRMVNPVYAADSAEPPSRASRIAVMDPSAAGFLRVVDDTYLSDAASTLEPPR